MSAWISMNSDADASSDLLDTLQLARTPHGTVDNVMRVHSHRPNTMRGHVALYRAAGEISWNLLDPTVFIDGVAIWEQGRLYPERLANVEAILSRHPNLAELFNNPVRAIGLTG